MTQGNWQFDACICVLGPRLRSKYRTSQVFMNICSAYPTEGNVQSNVVRATIAVDVSPSV